jgi:ankyrin repeat protein
VSQSFFDLIRRGSTAEVAAWVEENPAIAATRNAQGISALLWAIYSAQPVIRDFLLARLASLDIWEAAAAGDVQRLELALSAPGGDVHAFSADGWTALHLACGFGTAEAVRLLLERGADVHARSTNALANQPLHAALAMTRDPESVRLLLLHGADPNAPQHGGFTPLHQAAAAGRADLIALLLAQGADPRVRSDAGKTPADLARERGHHEAARMLD